MGIRIILFLAFLGTVLSCQSPRNGPIPVDVAKYYHAFWMHSDSGHARDYYVQIALPRTYYEGDSATYPVLFLTDADLCFGIARDIALATGWPDREAIVVGVGYGSVQRLMEFRHADYGTTPDETGVAGCVRYVSFLENELMPKVEREYRANVYNRTLMTWSWGVGLFGHVLEERPGLFQNHIAGGGWLPDAWVDSLYDQSPALPANIYLGIGDRDGSKDRLEAFARSMAAKDFWGMQLQLEIFPQKGHEVVTLADLLDRGMKWVYSRKPVEPRLRMAMKLGGVERVLEEYRSLRRTNRRDYLLEPDRLSAFADSLGRQGIGEARRTILEYLDREHPVRTIRLRVLPNAVLDPGTIFVAGNLPSLGNWDPGQVALQAVGDSTWEGNFSLRAGTDLEFKITRGSWATQAADSAGTPLSNVRMEIAADTTLTMVIERWSDER